MPDRNPDREKQRRPQDPVEQRARIDEDLALIEMVSGGSTAHWHAFVDRYAGLIYSVIRRQLFAEDDDDVRTVFADVLEALYQGKLTEFRGRSTLSTWLIVVSRGMALDHLRRRDGRRKMPRGFESLSEFEQDIFRLHNVEGLSFELIVHSLESAGKTATSEEIANAVLKIESMFDRHYLRRLEFEARAPALGVASGRLLDFMQREQLRQERTVADRPDTVFEAREIEKTARRVRDLLAGFSQEEQDVIRLRFDEDKSAREIAEELGFSGQRKVYTIIDGVARRIRKLMQ